MNTWTDWFAANRNKVGPSWLQSVEYMYPVYNHLYQHAPPHLYPTLLEIGCGMGDSARALAIMGYHVKGIDNDTQILERVTNHPVMVSNGNLHFEFGDAFDPPKGFSVSTSFGIIEHYPRDKRVELLSIMRQCSSICVVTIPSPLLCNTVKRDMGEHDISMKQLIYDCRDAGWYILDLFGFGTPPKYITLHDYLPPAIWRRLQYRGSVSLSFCVIGCGDVDFPFRCE